MTETERCIVTYSVQVVVGVPAAIHSLEESLEDSGWIDDAR